MIAKEIGKTIAAALLTTVFFTALPGCERKEKLIDIETPSGEVEVERDKDSGAVDVEVAPDEGQ